MKDIDRRIAILDIEGELAKTLEPCPFCGGSLSDFPGVMIFEKRRINTDLYHVHCIHCGAMGTVTYDRKLSQQEIEAYELTEVSE